MEGCVREGRRDGGLREGGEERWGMCEGVEER